MIELTIKNLKGISDFHISLPYEKGVYVITGENGVGKSTILSVLSLLVYEKALISTFRYEGDDSTCVTISLDGLTNIWGKKAGQWIQQDTNPPIKCKGTLESSLIFGSRFADAHKDALKNIKNVKDSDLVDAAPFVIENFGHILRDDKSYYIGLKRVCTDLTAQSYGFKRVFYIWIPREKHIRLAQFFMSSGELLLIGLLDFLNRVKYETNKKSRVEKSIILIDEIELALHPSAQKRLLELLVQLSSEYELCIYIATHSIPIINAVPPSKNFYIQRNRETYENCLEVIPNCYPAYATRSLYTEKAGFDFLILVEDKLAQYVVEKILDEKQLRTSKLIKVLPCGGWEQTLKLQAEFEDSSLAGKSCKMISVLDGDIKLDYEEKYEKEKYVKKDDGIYVKDSERKQHRFTRLTKSFLPIKSVEKYIKEKLLVKPDSAFFNTFGDTFYSDKRLSEIIKEYQNELLKKQGKEREDKDGKILWEKLKDYALAQGLSEERFEDKVCEFVYKHDNFVPLKNFVEKQLTRMKV